METERDESTGGWLCRLSDPEGGAPLELSVQLADDWLVVALFVDVPAAPALAVSLLKLNASLAHAKVGLGAGTTVVLWTEVAARDASAEQIASAAGAVVAALGELRAVVRRAMSRQRTPFQLSNPE